MVIDFVNRLSARTAISPLCLVGWMELSRSKYYQWKDRYGKANEHNALIPRDHWLEQWEKDAIIDFQRQFPLEGYRRLTFMMLDRDIVAVSPSSTYRVLKNAGLLDSWKPKPSLKGTRLCAAAGTPRALAYRCLLYQHLRHLLLPLLVARRLLALHRSLGAARGHDRG
jgi:hypothetical protein